MNKSLVTTVTMLGILMFPLNAMAAERSSVKHNTVKYGAGQSHKHQQWQNHREHRREALQHRTAHPSFNRHVIRTDYRAVKKAVLAHRAKHSHDNNWAINRPNDYRFLNRRDFYIYYYGNGNSRHYDRHREHYLEYHRDRQSHHNQYDNDYFEWVAIMALLNDIYDDDQ
ncbi:MAG: hypothetical protein P8P26_06665 [Porticoccaceae bacterium]|nr:hypothetical protein [Porticoccaceae bacterium]